MKESRGLITKPGRRQYGLSQSAFFKREGQERAEMSQQDRLAEKISLFQAAIRFVMHERIESGLGDSRVSGQISDSREKWPWGSSFQSAVKQIVERRIRSGRTDVRVRFEIMLRIKKDRIANGLEFV
jgi:hypothetical protein